MQQDLFTLPVHMSSPWILSGVRFARSLVFCVMLCRSLFVLFHLALALFVLIRLMDCDYPFCISKLVTVLIDSSFVSHIEKKGTIPFSIWIHMTVWCQIEGNNNVSSLSRICIENVIAF